MTEVIAQIERKHTAYTEGIREVMATDKVSYNEAKKSLLNSLKWRVLTYQMNSL